MNAKTVLNNRNIGLHNPDFQECVTDFQQEAEWYVHKLDDDNNNKQPNRVMVHSKWSLVCT